MIAPQEMVERAVAEMFPAGNEPTFEQYDEIFQPDFEWRPRTGAAVSGRTYIGRDGLARYAVDLRESFELFEPRDTEYLVDGELVLARSQIRVRGSESGIELEHEGAVIWQLRDGKLASARAFFSHAEANEEFDARVRA